MVDIVRLHNAFVERPPPLSPSSGSHHKQNLVFRHPSKREWVRPLPPVQLPIQKINGNPFLWCVVAPQAKNLIVCVSRPTHELDTNRSDLEFLLAIARPGIPPLTALLLQHVSLWPYALLPSLSSFPFPKLLLSPLLTLTHSSTKSSNASSLIPINPLTAQPRTHPSSLPHTFQNPMKFPLPKHHQQPNPRPPTLNTNTSSPPQT